MRSTQPMTAEAAADVVAIQQVLFRYAYALDARDYPLLQGIFLLVAVAVVLANFAADMVYGLLDPRVRS